LTRPVIAALFHAVRPLFAAAIDLGGSYFAAAINSLGALLAALVVASGLLSAGEDFAAEPPARRSLLTLFYARRRRGTLGTLTGGRPLGAWSRGGPINPRSRRTAAVFATHLLAFCAGFTPVQLVPLCGKRGHRHRQREHGSQRRKRSARLGKGGKEGHHHSCLQKRPPTTSGLLRCLLLGGADCRRDEPPCRCSQKMR
jgi:hypothetical protein